ncbi:Chitin synthase, class 5 [Vanrija albida]|uniref:chitin synthase n=1 Tax=Vanrija albida TaxID=181172 RepID=A0ABR3Q1T9_9TREE
MASLAPPSGQANPRQRFSSRFEGITDLCALPSIAEDTILATLRERYITGQPYTSVSSSALVNVNPLIYLPLNGDASLQDYVTEYYRSAGDDTVGDPENMTKERLGPHIFRHGLSAYYNMRRTGQDQILLLSGASGSGKTEMRRLAIKAISEVAVAPPGKKGYKVGQQIANAEFILESFGNAQTVGNENASRFGNYTELQFTDRGRLEGLKTIEYYLERSRVSQPPASGERNFHIFYYLVSGVDGEERQHLRLGNVNDYRYLVSRARRTGTSDRQRFNQIKQAFKSVGLSNRLVAQVCQLLAAILHIGNFNFVDDPSMREGATVTNYDSLATAAEFLGVSNAALAELFAFKTVLVRKEVCTTFLDSEQAEDVRDELARTLYSLLFSWLNEYINQKLCKEQFGSFIAILDLPGLQNNAGPSLGVNSVDQFCFNFANEKLHNWILHRIHEAPLAEASADQLPMNRIPYFDNTECLKMLADSKGGLIAIADDQAKKKKTDANMIEAMAKCYTGHSSFQVGNMDRSGTASFTINHYAGPVTYTAESFIERNANETSADILRLLRGTATGAATSVPDHQGSNNPFIRSLFSNKSIATQAHPRNDETIVAAQQPVRPMRAPSTRRKRGPRLSAVSEEAEEEDNEVGGGNDEGNAGTHLSCVAGQHWNSLSTLFATFDQIQPWFVFCLRPNDSQLPAQVETRSVKAQIRSLGLTEITQRLRSDYEVRMTHEEFADRYEDEFAERAIGHQGAVVDRLRDLKRVLKLSDEDMAVGSSRMFLSHHAFHRFEDRLREAEGLEEPAHLDDARQRQREDPFSPGHRAATPENEAMFDFNDRNDSAVALPLVHNAQPLPQASPSSFDDHERGFAPSQVTSPFGDRDTQSHIGSESYAPSRNMFRDMDDKRGEKDVMDDLPQDDEVTEVYKESAARRRWVILCRILTWWCPDFFLDKIGRMKRQDIRQAWREKLAINLLIWFICGCTIFVIAGLGLIICPRQHVYTVSERESHNGKGTSAYVSIRGEVFNLDQILPVHRAFVPIVDQKTIFTYAGKDATGIFPIQVSAVCSGQDGQGVSPYVTTSNTNNTATDIYAKYHDFRAFTNDSRPDWYTEQMIGLRSRYRTGWMGYTKKDLKSLAGQGFIVGIYHNLVYDLTDYVRAGGGGVKLPNGVQDPNAEHDRQFLHPSIVQAFQQYSGQDVTSVIDGLSSSIGKDIINIQGACLRNIFIKGKLDTRDSAQCQFSTYILLALSAVMVAVIGFKFLAAIHFGPARAPENHDKFVICQVPCYTEGEQSLRRTIDSLAKLRYDDKRKLLCIICDGNIKGYGNDKPTPAIVLDILGVDPNLDPEPLSFQSLGEGSKQHNMGKVYAGLYECSGHVVPYLVIVKVGKPTERPKPGNRGKRDSQMLLMHFLNKVHFNSPMNPLELEMYHQIKNVIGVNPSFYEYLFMVDADTTVDELSLNRLVSACMHDKKIVGICGETSIANAKQSIVTMSQVYEYFISHHLAKAFENLFGSITCLPGCFTMYRLRTPDTHKPLFIANSIIHDYSENRVDTLHLKNLLHLGEDRYLTTLVLKHFPTYKTKFVRDAKAQTVAPDSAKVLFSQRRRWINSTVHNMAELIFQENMCGFCCFSMRFVVLIDLVSTIVAPVTVAYIGYLIYIIVRDGGNLPILSIAMLAAIYGLQALVFIFRMRWDMIAWMIFYILAIPVFSFYLPLYSFWRMDDFSWGSTRLVVGERGKKLVIHDEGKFDPKSIPLKSWNDYENELWDQESNHSQDTWLPPQKSEYLEGSRQSAYNSQYGSQYGLGSIYQPSTFGHDTQPTQRSRGAISPAGSYSDIRGASRNGSYQDVPARGTFYAAGGRGGDTSSYGHGDAQSLYAGSFYGQPPLAPVSSNHHGAVPAGGDASDSITDAQLQASVRRICQGADLDTLTKKSVRKQLEAEYGVSLTSRKDYINQQIEEAIAE